jgi:hypothetical protein
MFQASGTSTSRTRPSASTLTETVTAPTGLQVEHGGDHRSTVDVASVEVTSAGSRADDSLLPYVVRAWSSRCAGLRHVTWTTSRQERVEKSAARVRKALARHRSRPPWGCDGRRKVSLFWRCVVLDVALVALTILVFAVLALVLRGLERL